MFAALYPELCEGFEIFGIVKETGVDDEGLAEFQQKYFQSYPIYLDKSYAFYQALGDRKVGLSQVIFNPFALFGVLCDAYHRITSKSVGGNVRGEGIVQGGIIMFGVDGKPVCMYEEETGTDLRVADIATALEAVRLQSKHQKQLLVEEEKKEPAR